MTGPVVIAGAGPVGLTAAWALERAGVDVIVLEAGDELAAQSRASTFHPPSLEMLAELGVIDEMLARGLRAPTFQHRERGGGVVAELDLAVLAGETPYPFRLQLEQSKLTPLLARRLGDRVRFGARVVSAESDGDRVAAVLASGERVDGSWLIAADGAHSAVRRSLDVAFDGETYPERYLVVSTSADFAELVPGIAAVNYLSDPQEWLVLLHAPSGWRALFPIGDGESDDQALDPVSVEQRLQAAVPRDTPYPVLHTSLYRVHQRVAAGFRHGRVLLAGDAAHINNPLGGMGMNSGIHDAVTLAATLATVAEGAPERLVDDWADARRAVAMEIVGAETKRSYERLRQNDPAERARQQAALRTMAADPEQARVYLRRACLLDSARAGMPAVPAAR